MMPLPPGCKVGYHIWIDVDTLTDDMCEWFEMIGGRAELHSEWRGFKEIFIKTVQYGAAKPSYRRQDGTGHVKINFTGDDASTASVFLIKFSEHVLAHNMQQEFNLVK